MYIEGFITNLDKYKEGILIGEWITFPIKEDDFKKVLVNIGFEDIRCQEYFFMDWKYCDDCPDLHFLKTDRINDINNIAEKLEEITDNNKFKFLAMVEAYSLNDALTCDYDNVYLYENVNSENELGRFILYEQGVYVKQLEAMGDLANYIDFEAFGRDNKNDGTFTNYGWLKW